VYHLSGEKSRRILSKEKKLGKEIEIKDNKSLPLEGKVSASPTDEVNGFRCDSTYP